MTAFPGVDGWRTAFAEIVENRWVHCPNIIDAATASVLASEADLEWRDLKPEGVVLQEGAGAVKALPNTSEEVRSLEGRFYLALDHAALATLGESVPRFNEAIWTHYPKDIGYISTHQDADDFTGLIAIFTTAGSATFRVFDSDGRKSEIEASAGDLVLIGAHQWPRPDSTCPLHEVDPPAKSDRSILTFRSNRNGPGGGYTV